MIELNDIKKVYPSRGAQVVALDGVSLTIKDGAVFGVIGQSGAGKSTLVRCINLLERPTSGQVLIDGEDVTSTSAKRLASIRKNIGMIFQSFNLLEQRTVEANVRFPLELVRSHRHIKEQREREKERVDELLRLVELSDKAKAYPSQLSGGQKQRVAIARALALRPKYLLCDEATSALDPQTTRSILQLLKDINQKLGVTVVIITHEMKVVESVCDEVAVLSDGKIAECGKVSDIFSRPHSDVAKELIIPELIRTLTDGSQNKLRLIFDGEVSDSPVISGLALECDVKANILYADTKSIDGKPFGHMVLSIVGDSSDFKRAKRYLNEHNVQFEEEI